MNQTNWFKKWLQRSR